ncbi:hypothetical protein ACVQ92_13150 [Staphylococcus aureus]
MTTDSGKEIRGIISSQTATCLNA